VYLLAVFVLTGGILLVAQEKASTNSANKQGTMPDKKAPMQRKTGPNAKQKTAEKLSAGPPIVITIENCIANPSSVPSASGPVLFYAKDQDYYVFIEKEEIFKEHEHYRLVHHNSSELFTPNPPNGGGKIKSLWWADPLGPCTKSAAESVKGGGDPNDITVP
jgi:hypothetical protein